MLLWLRYVCVLQLLKHITLIIKYKYFPDILWSTLLENEILF